MFEKNPKLKCVPATRDRVVAIIESINSPMVAADNRPLEPAKAFIVGVRNRSGLFTVYVYLHLLQSKECLIYLPEHTEIPMEAYHETEIDAIQFVESMGFMLDNLNFRSLPVEQQEALMESLPVFSEDLKEFARRSEHGSEPGSVDEITEDVVDLEELAEEPAENTIQPVSEEALKKIIRLLASF